MPDSEASPPSLDSALPPGAAPSPSWLPPQTADDQSTSNVPLSTPREKTPAADEETADDDEPPTNRGFQLGGRPVAGWQVLLVLGVCVGAWSLIQAYAFTSTTAAWNEFDLAPTCQAGQPTDACRASILVSLTVEKKSTSSCEIYAYPTTGGGRFVGFFSGDACNLSPTTTGSSLRSRVAVLVWHGQLVKVPGTGPSLACTGNTPFFSPLACSGVWSDDSSLGQHWSAAPNLLKALAIDAGFALIVVLWLLGKIVGFIGRHV